MKIESLQFGDLQSVARLQPETWPDIIPDLTFYLNSGFCSPLKAVINGQIVGTGTFINFGKTAWLAHIIVDKEQRNKGIGYQIVQKLLQLCKKNKIETTFLIATELGKPVYEKAGFKHITEYCFLKQDTIMKSEYALSIEPYDIKYKEALYQMDAKATGENREKLLNRIVFDSFIYVKNNVLLGYYLPSLKEGSIIAIDPGAGKAFMDLRMQRNDRAVLPIENNIAIEYLLKSGYHKLEVKGTRMYLGKKNDWNPHFIYNRIGGNFG